MRDHARIGTPALSIKASQSIILLPSFNPAMGSTLEVVGFEQQGWFLELRDPYGTLVWQFELVGDGAEPMPSSQEIQNA